MDFSSLKKKLFSKDEDYDVTQDMQSIKEQIVDMPSEGHMDESIPAAPTQEDIDAMMAEVRQEMPEPFAGPLDEELPPIEMQPATPVMPAAEDAPQGRTLRNIKGPVFISLKKYKELRANLNELKDTSESIKETLKQLKGNRDSGFDLLEGVTDHLMKLEKEAEAINRLVKN